MNKLEFSNVRASFLQRRYGVRLGKRYAIAAASVLLLSLIPIHHKKALNGLESYDERGVDRGELINPF